MATTVNLELPREFYNQLIQQKDAFKSNVCRQVEDLFGQFLRNIKVVDRSQQLVTPTPNSALSSLVVNRDHGGLVPIAFYANSNGQLVPTSMMRVQSQTTLATLAQQQQQQSLTHQQQTINTIEDRQLTNTVVVNGQEQQVDYANEQTQQQLRRVHVLIRPREVSGVSLDQNQYQQQQPQPYLTNQQPNHQQLLSNGQQPFGNNISPIASTSSFVSDQQQQARSEQLNRLTPIPTNFQGQDETATKTPLSQTNGSKNVVPKEEMGLENSTTVPLNSGNQNSSVTLSSTTDFVSLSPTTQNVIKEEVEQANDPFEVQEVRGENNRENDAGELVIDEVGVGNRTNADKVADADDGEFSNSDDWTEEDSDDSFCQCADCNDGVEWLPENEIFRKKSKKSLNKAPGVLHQHLRKTRKRRYSRIVLSRHSKRFKRCKADNSNSQMIRTFDATSASANGNSIDCTRLRAKLNSKTVNTIQPSQTSLEQAQTPQQQTSETLQFAQFVPPSFNNSPQTSTTSTVQQHSGHQEAPKRGRPVKHHTKQRRTLLDRNGNYVCLRCDILFPQKHLLREHQTNVHGWGGVRRKGISCTANNNGNLSSNVQFVQSNPIQATVFVSQPQTSTSTIASVHNFEQQNSSNSPVNFTPTPGLVQVNSTNNFSITDPNMFFPIATSSSSTNQANGNTITTAILTALPMPTQTASEGAIVNGIVMNGGVIGANGNGVFSPYVCHLCNNSYSNSFNLNRHLFRHQKVKPFRCKWAGCNQRGSQKCDLIRHIRIQHFHLPKTMREQKEQGIADVRDPNDYIHEDEELMKIFRQNIPQK